jgi:hypothetical protein
MVEGHGWTELQEGDEFAGYRIERRLGRGGMGILYLAVEPGLDRRVALKLIAPEAAADEVFARRFAEESRIAASIEHPNVVPIYAAGEHDGVPYIAMRYVSGSDLSRRIAREGKLEPATAAALIAQVGNGLDAIHAAGLVHRDVKPANVLLSGSDHAYITDFGVARNVATESGLTQTGRFVGTLDYVAPEQISGATVDARVDVYALGCLLFKLLTGEVPYPREGEAARLYAHLNDPPPAPSLYSPAVPIALDDVVIRAMSKAPEDRYPSAGDLGRAAEAALRGDAVAIPERTVATGAAATREAETIPVASGGGSPGRRRLLLAGGALVAAALAVVVIVLSSGGGSDPGSAAGATTPAKAQQGGGEVKTAKQKSKPKPLTEAELIAKGDAVCTRSQETFKEVRQRFPGGEEEPDPVYSRELAGISTRAVREFNELTPPPNLEAEYKRYVQAQERVHAYDEQALSAAQNGDAGAYARARERRDSEQSERHAIATSIGFDVCSAG